MQLEVVKCKECSAVLKDPFSIQIHPVLGAYFKCDYCQGVNVIHVPNDSIPVIETITKKPIVSMSDSEIFSTIDKLPTRNTPISPITIEPMKDLVVIGLPDDLHYPDFGALYNPLMVSASDRSIPNGIPSVKLPRNDTTIGSYVSTLVSLLKQTTSFSTLILSWNDIYSLANEYVKQTMSKTPEIFAIRNDIFDYIFKLLESFRRDGITVHILYKYKECQIGIGGYICDIPRQLHYQMTEALVYHGRTIYRNYAVPPIY